MTDDECLVWELMSFLFWWPTDEALAFVFCGEGSLKVVKDGREA